MTDVMWFGVLVVVLLLLLLGLIRWVDGQAESAAGNGSKPSGVSGSRGAGRRTGRGADEFPCTGTSTPHTSSSARHR